MEGKGSLVKERANKQVAELKKKNMLLSLEKGKEEMLREELNKPD